MAGGWDEETFLAQYRSAMLLRSMGRIHEAASAFIAAWQLRHTRLEPLIRLSELYREKGMHHAAVSIQRKRQASR